MAARWRETGPLLIARSSLRSLLHHRWQLALAVGGIALGVAVAVGMAVATQSARGAFALSRSALSPLARYELVGGPRGVREGVLAPLRAGDGGVAPTLLPLVEDEVRLVGERPETLHVVGLDLLGPSASLDGTVAVAPEQLTTLLLEPGAAIVAAPLAARHGWHVGSLVAVEPRGAQSRPTLRVIGTFEPAAGAGATAKLTRQATQDLVLVDISTAQELLGKVGWLTRIDVLAPQGEGSSLRGDGASAETAAQGTRTGMEPSWVVQLRGRLPADVRLVALSQEADGLDQLTRALHLNLTALSLLALVVGAFLVYNTMAFTVVRRRPLLASLRTLGVTRGELFRLLQLEALALGLVGTALGLAGGVALAGGLLRLVSRTIDDLYFVSHVRSPVVTLSALVWGMALGLGATQLAALGPAWEAATVTPRSALSRSLLEQSWGRRLRRFALVGLGLLVLGFVAALWPSRALAPGFASVLALLLGGALVSPLAVAALLSWLARPLGALMGPVGRLACRGVVASMSRTAVALAALVITVAATVGVEVMVRSFRSTVEHWLDLTLAADIYVSPAGRNDDVTIDSASVERVRALAGVARVDTHRGVTVLGDHGPIQLAAIEIDPRVRGERRLPLELLEPGDAAWRAYDEGEGVFVSESYAYREGFGAGAQLQLPTDRGAHTFVVAALYRDFGTPAGTVLMSRRTYGRYWSDPGSSSLAVYLANAGTAGVGAAVGGGATALGAAIEAEQVLQRVRTALIQGPRLHVRSNRALRQLSLEIFDRTFAITQVLRLLTAFVAVVGLFGALLGLALDRARELAVMRALGMTRGQLWGLVVAQNGLLGLGAGLLALPLGLALAAVLTYVIDRRSFGWTLELSISGMALLQLVLLALGAAVLAGLYPAWRTAQVSPALALREE